MNALINATESKTMSSREIAELTVKEHKNVLRVIRDLIVDGILAAQIEPLKFEYRGQWFDYYELNKRDSLVVVARLCPEFMAAVIDRWQELESQVVKPKELTNLEIFQLAVETEKANILLTEQLSIAAPKVNYYDKIVVRENLLNASQVAQKLKLSAVKLNKLLDELGVYNGAVKNSRIFKQWFVDKGFGFIRQTELGYSQAMFTLRGEAWVVEKLVSEGLA